MEFLNGQTGKNIEDNGRKGNKMMKVKYMTLSKINGLLENGIWEKKLNVMYNSINKSI